MSHSMRFFATVLLLAMLIMATEMGPMKIIEAKTCERLSGTFKGICFSSKNCASVCENEDEEFTGGHCSGLRRRCYCTADC
ncbi:Defensin-like protein 1 [Capsicum annuum]|uniref:Defensin-like protein 1 n=1 Tax=Capsicum annuum TaxID=4072 RepID=A0A2G2Z0N4_CAPAN|nr:defensin-like protein P322 [Capsicum annuum]KAF3616125.1 Defensin-like protein 1 [Capsicum annuum]KAF3621012.1 Defensin-like protein 1 [Capsicum annuum]PHT75533.1 Defensin-like protein 1 [Capsicum annuum]